MTEVANQNLNTHFNQSYEEFSDAIFRYCLYQTSNREKALDLTQDTFIKTWEYLSNGKKVDNLRAFLYKVAGNLVIDYRRKKKAESLDSMTEAGFDVKDEINEMAQKENVYEKDFALKVIEQLDEKYKEVLLLKFTEDMSIQEIAKIMNQSINNISVRLHRGIAQLKEIMAHHELVK